MSKPEDMPNTTDNLPPISSGSDLWKDEERPTHTPKRTNHWVELIRFIISLPVLIVLVIRDYFRGDLNRTPEPVFARLPFCLDYDDDCQGVKDCHTCSCYNGEKHCDGIDNLFSDVPVVYCLELDRRQGQLSELLEQ